MDIMPFYLVFLQSLPETAILIYLGLVLTGIESPGIIRILCISLFTSLVCYFVRRLSLPIGIHVFLQLPFLILFLAVIGRLSLVYSTIVSFLGFIFLCLMEGILNFIISSLTGISVLTAISNPILRILFPLPEFLVLSGCIFFLKHHKIVLFDLRSLWDSDRKYTS